MKKVLGLIVGLCFAGGIYAQEIVADSTSANEQPWSLQTTPKMIKFSPLDVFSIVPTFGADVEVKMKKATSLQVGAGVMPSFMQFLSNEVFGDYDRMGGYKLRAEGRVYMPVKTNRYIAVGATFRHFIIRDEVAVGMEGFTNEFGFEEFAYFVNTPMVFHRFNTLFDLKLGFQRISADNLVFDFYTGLSIRNVRVHSGSDIPDGGGFPPQRGPWTLENGHRLTYPTPIFGFKIGFVK